MFNQIFKDLAQKYTKRSEDDSLQQSQWQIMSYLKQNLKMTFILFWERH